MVFSQNIVGIFGTSVFSSKWDSLVSDFFPQNSTRPLFSFQFMKFQARCFESCRRVTNLNEVSTLHHNDGLLYFYSSYLGFENDPEQKQPIIVESKRIISSSNHTLDCPDITLSIIMVIVLTSWRDIFVAVLDTHLSHEEEFPENSSVLSTFSARGMPGRVRAWWPAQRQSTCSPPLM